MTGNVDNYFYNHKIIIKPCIHYFKINMIAHINYKYNFFRNFTSNANIIKYLQRNNECFSFPDYINNTFIKIWNKIEFLKLGFKYILINFCDWVSIEIRYYVFGYKIASKTLLKNK